MAAPETELQRITTGESHRFEFKIGLGQLGHLFQPANGTVALAAALGARAGPAQCARRVARSVAIIPVDGENLGLPVKVDSGGKGVDQGALPAIGR